MLNRPLVARGSMESATAASYHRAPHGGRALDGPRLTSPFMELAHGTTPCPIEICDTVRRLVRWRWWWILPQSDIDPQQVVSATREGM
jgi:hypothetical protein